MPAGKAGNGGPGQQQTVAKSTVTPATASWSPAKETSQQHPVQQNAPRPQKSTVHTAKQHTTQRSRSLRRNTAAVAKPTAGVAAVAVALADLLSPHHPAYAAAAWRTTTTAMPSAVNAVTTGRPKTPRATEVPSSAW